jgi:hypothetical protein
MPRTHSRQVASMIFKDRCDVLLDEARPGQPRTIYDDQVAAVIDRTLSTTPSSGGIDRKAAWPG